MSRAQIIRVTENALHAVDAARFFETERGFHGRFYCALQALLDSAGLITNGAILEMEYQKSGRHELGRRPDIIFHIPTEHSGERVKANNFAVWALKRHAIATDALDDFHKLDEMFGSLDCPLGFFINIDSNNTMLEHYRGTYGPRLYAFAIKRSEGGNNAIWEPQADA